MIAALVFAALMRVGPAAPEFTNPQARAHFDTAARGFAEGRYADAAAELRRAYQLEPVAELLYASAQAQRLAGVFAAAAETYADYLETDPPTSQAANARMMLLYCRVRVQASAGACSEAGALLATYVELYPEAPDVATAQDAVAQCRAPDEPTTTTTAPTDTPPPRVPAEPPQGTRRRPWHRDVTAGVLVGVGSIAAAAGTTVALVGRNTFGRGTVADSHDRAASLMDRGITLERVGVGVAAAGGAILAAGVIRWIVLATAPRRRPRSGAQTASWRGASGLIASPR